MLQIRSTDRGLSFTSYKLRLPGEDKILNTEDDVITFDSYANPPVPWNPAASLVPLGEQIIGALKTDMDDMSGVNQYISGQAEAVVDQKTATEVQQLATASARRVNAKKKASPWVSTSTPSCVAHASRMTRRCSASASA